MARRHVEMLIDRKSINDINDNFKELFDGYVGAGDDAAEARKKAEQALADSILAKIDAEKAKDIADSVRDELSAIIREQTSGGDVAPEVVQARGDKSTLGERLDLTDDQVSQSASDIKALDERLALVDANLTHITTEISLDTYRDLFVGNDVTNALRQAIDDAPVGSSITFNPDKTYVISDTLSVDKPINIDFNNALTELKVDNEHVFELLFAGGERDFHDRINLTNYFFKTAEGYTPKSIIYVNGSINTLLDGSMADCAASHSLIWNYSGYGTRIRGEFRRNKTPRVIYLSNSSGYAHSFAFDIDVDITGNTGLGIETEGANGNVRGVIESCTGGYFYNGVHISGGINISVHFEANTEYDLKIGVPEYVSDGSRNAGVTNVIGSYGLFFGEGNNLLFGSGQQINLIGGMGFKAGAIDGFVNKTTTVISEVGNFSGAGLLSEEDRDVVGYTGLLRRSTYLQDLLIKGGIIRSPDTIKFRPSGLTSSKITLTEDGVLPQHLNYDLGGAFNRFNYIYGRYINLTSPNGTQYRIDVSDNGDIRAVKR